MIPVTVVARDEEAAIGPCLDALLPAVRRLQERTGAPADLRVVLDDCTDGTLAAVRARGVRAQPSSGGKVEAQRAALRGGPFHIFVDADVLVAPDTLAALAGAMADHPGVEVAFPRKRPLPPVRGGRLARALHLYNRATGHSSQRTWFSGKCFAIRRWAIPTRDELAARIATLPRDRFYAFEAGVRADDIYLSRAIVAAHGPGALLEVSEGAIWFRAPETLRGMYRTYLRMRMELERTSALCPELEAAHARHGRRRADRLAAAPAAERRAYREFQLWLALCRAGYRLERAYYRHLARTTRDPWPPIPETKCLSGTAIPA